MRLRQSCSIGAKLGTWLWYFCHCGHLYPHSLWVEFLLLSMLGFLPDEGKRVSTRRCTVPLQIPSAEILASLAAPIFPGFSLHRMQTPKGFVPHLHPVPPHRITGGTVSPSPSAGIFLGNLKTGAVSLVTSRLQQSEGEERARHLRVRGIRTCALASSLKVVGHRLDAGVHQDLTDV